MPGLTPLLGKLSLDQQVRGRQFEELSRWFFANDRLYQRQLRRIWLWQDWPGRWGADAGIDLVAEAESGDLWAIQAKAYDPRYTITRPDVDTFLAESARPQFAYRLIIATTNKIGRTAKRTIDAQGVPVGLLLLADLEKAPVDWPHSPNYLRPRRIRPKRPFAHNREAVSAVCRGFNNSDRGQLIMACGTGKTLVGLWTAERLGCRRTLILLPSLSLLAQTMREWAANARKPFAVLAVCSDESVADDDRLVEHTSELGLPVTTDAEDIAAFLRRRGPSVVFATYQSSPQVAKAQAAGVPRFDLAIADEAHRCAGPATSEFATILDGTAIRAKRRLFMTATPRYPTERVRAAGKLVDWEIASMDDPELFGKEFHRLSFAEAIDRGLLSDYQVAIFGVDDDTYRDFAERAALVSIDGKTITDARTLAGQVGLAQAIRKYDLRRVISFHSRVKWARSFSASLSDTVAWMPPRHRPSGKLWSDYVSGEMPSGRRDVLLSRLRHLDEGERGVLANARCLGEGVDVPAIDGVTFIDPRRSQVDIVQAVGRAIRRSTEKKLGTVVLPVFIDTTEDPEVALGSSAFKPVWAVLRALRAHDDTLGEQLDALRRELGQRKLAKPRLPSKIKIDLPVKLGPEFAQALSVRLVEQTTATWELWLGLLQRYVEREGHARVPFERVEKGFRLGAWVNGQRTSYASGQLSQEREKRLEALPGWAWDARDALWDENFNALVRFVEREGHARVPIGHIENGLTLGQWVSAQRGVHARGQLPRERVNRLEALPGWAWDAREAVWEENFNALARFVEREGHAQMPALHIEDGMKLGGWVRHQRLLHSRGQLPNGQVERLEALQGWVWDVFDTAWDRGFEALIRFVDAGGPRPGADWPYRKRRPTGAVG